MTTTVEHLPENVLMEVLDERKRQDEKWGQQNHPDRDTDPKTGAGLRPAKFASQATAMKMVNMVRPEVMGKDKPKDRNSFWDSILLEEVYEALAEEDPAKLRAELIQVAAVAVAWVEAIDRR